MTTMANLSNFLFIVTNHLSVDVEYGFTGRYLHIGILRHNPEETIIIQHIIPAITLKVERLSNRLQQIIYTITHGIIRGRYHATGTVCAWQGNYLIIP